MTAKKFSVVSFIVGGAIGACIFVIIAAIISPYELIKSICGYRVNIFDYANGKKVKKSIRINPNNPIINFPSDSGVLHIPQKVCEKLTGKIINIYHGDTCMPFVVPPVGCKGLIPIEF